VSASLLEDRVVDVLGGTIKMSNPPGQERAASSPDFLPLVVCGYDPETGPVLENSGGGSHEDALPTATVTEPAASGWTLRTGRDLPCASENHSSEEWGSKKSITRSEAL
jgi:hypothetical protein